MPNYINNMNLAIWDQPSDVFDYTQLAKNFTDIAAHDHSSGKGTQIGNGGIATDAITDVKISASAAISPTKIANATTVTSGAITFGTTAGGALSGTYPSPSLANRTVDRVNIKQGIVPDIVNGDASGNGLPTTGLFDGYTVDYNFSKNVPVIESGSITAASTGGTSGAYTYTYTTSSHHLLIGDVVTITGVSPTAYNITGIISATSGTTQFTLNKTCNIDGSSAVAISTTGGTYSSGGSWVNPYVGYTSAGNPEYFSWRLRYNGSTNNWDCLGGNPFAYTYNANVAITGTSRPTTANGLYVTLPFKGKYIISYVVTGRMASNTAMPYITKDTSYRVYMVSYNFGTTLFDNTTELGSNARAAANMTQNLTSYDTVGAGSNYGTASNIYKTNMSSKILQTGLWRNDGSVDLILDSQSIVITPAGGLTA